MICMNDINLTKLVNNNAVLVSAKKSVKLVRRIHEIQHVNYVSIGVGVDSEETGVIKC